MTQRLQGWEIFKPNLAPEHCGKIQMVPIWGMGGEDGTLVELPLWLRVRAVFMKVQIHESRMVKIHSSCCSTVCPPVLSPDTWGETWSQLRGKWVLGMLEMGCCLRWQTIHSFIHSFILSQGEDGLTFSLPITSSCPRSQMTEWRRDTFAVTNRKRFCQAQVKLVWKWPKGDF